MPTDYSTLGFPVEGMRHLKKVAKKVLPLATEVSAPSGSSCAGHREAASY
jgi:hypothetical protein